MKFLTPIVILSIMLTNCGFKPIYGSKNSNFEIIEIINENENKNSFAIEKMVMALSNQEAVKDNKGDPSKKKLSITVNLIVKNEKDNVLINRNFSEEFSYDVQSDKFNMAQYEDNITNNLNNKVSNDIIFLLGTLK